MSIRHITKREIIIAIVALLVGVGIGFYMNSNEVKANKQITKRVIDNCIQSMTAANTLINSCGGAYKEATTCFLNIDSCNLQESGRKLGALNKEKEQAEEEIRRLTKDMDSIIGEVKKSE